MSTLDKLIEEATKDFEEVLSGMTTRQHADSMDALWGVANKHTPSDWEGIRDILNEDPSILYRDDYGDGCAGDLITSEIHSRIHTALLQVWQKWMFPKGRKHFET